MKDFAAQSAACTVQAEPAGGGGGIRTHGRGFSPYNGLAIRPLRPLEYPSNIPSWTDFIKLQRTCPGFAWPDFVWTVRRAATGGTMTRLRLDYSPSPTVGRRRCTSSEACPGEAWRRERDSNPRRSSRYGFQDRRLRPLGHPSGFVIIADAVDARKPLA